MRVTSRMITDQVTFNLSRSIDRFMRLQAMMSSGRRIIKPSDDPVGIQRDLRYRQVLAEIAQYKRNISSSLNQLATYDNILGDMKNLLSEAHGLALTLGNDTYDANARTSAANEAESLFNAILSLANSQVEGRYIFSGFRTNVKAFQISTTGIEYIGDSGVFRVEIESAVRVGINLIGSDILLKQLSILGQDADLEVGVDGSTLLENLHLGNGVDITSGAFPGQFRVTDNNLGVSILVDVGVDVDGDGLLELEDVVAGVNAQLAAGGITNLTLDYGLEGNNLRWAAASNGLISANTPLSNLNAGGGVDLLNGKILIHDATDTINVEIDLTSATNIGDVVTAINTTLTANGVNNVTASINAAGTGIDIVDSNGAPLGLMVDEISGSSTTASDLGILGEINPTLSGSDLNPILDFSVDEAAADQTTATDLGLLGDFSIAMAGEALATLMLETTPLSLLNSKQGFELGEIKISQGATFVYFDLGDSAYTTVGDLINALNNVGLNITASINSAQTGIQIESTSTTESLRIEEVGEGRTAHNLGIFGSPDILGSMMILIDALRNDDREVVTQLVGNLDLGMQELLSHRATVGAKVIRLETTDSRLTDLDYNFTKLLSEEEDADLTKLVTDLAMQENSYQAALIAAAKIIQPSLLDFLR